MTIGFAFIDCNLAKSYQTVFGFIVELLFAGSFIYLDENFLVGKGYDSREYFLDFKVEMLTKRRLVV